MEFIETVVFTREVLRLMTDEQFRDLQNLLSERPGAGVLIPGGNGLRKIRWRAAGRGKRGSVRVIYYWFVKEEQIYFLLAYGKGETDDISAARMKMLRRLVMEHTK